MRTTKPSMGLKSPRVLKQRLPPNNKGADEGPCASYKSMTEHLNGVNDY